MYRRLNTRNISTTVRRLAETPVAPTPVVSPPPITIKPKRKVGAFRGGFLGFLVGTTLTGVGAYYYLFDEYRASNSAVLVDVVQLQDSIRNLENHVLDLEKKVPKASKN